MAKSWRPWLIPTSLLQVFFAFSVFADLNVNRIKAGDPNNPNDPSSVELVSVSGQTNDPEKINEFLQNPIADGDFAITGAEQEVTTLPPLYLTTEESAHSIPQKLLDAGWWVLTIPKRELQIWREVYQKPDLKDFIYGSILLVTKVTPVATMWLASSDIHPALAWGYITAYLGTSVVNNIFKTTTVNRFQYREGEEIKMFNAAWWRSSGRQYLYDLFAHNLTNAFGGFQNSLGQMLVNSVSNYAGNVIHLTTNAANFAANRSSIIGYQIIVTLLVQRYVAAESLGASKVIVDLGTYPILGSMAIREAMLTSFGIATGLTVLNLVAPKPIIWVSNLVSSIPQALLNYVKKLAGNTKSLVTSAGCRLNLRGKKKSTGIDSDPIDPIE